MKRSGKRIVSIFLQIALLFLPVFAAANNFSHHGPDRQYLNQAKQTQKSADQTNNEDETKASDETKDQDQNKKDEKKEESREKVKGSVTFTERGVGGYRQSAKFNEYRDIVPGGSGGLGLDYQKGDGFYLNLGAQNIGLTDVRAGLNFGSYGSYKINASFIGIPHNYAFDAKTLFTGVGTDTLSISGAIQNQLQGVLATNAALNGGFATPAAPIPCGYPGSAEAPPNCRPTSLLVDPFKIGMGALATDLSLSGRFVDIGLVRNRSALDIDVPAGSPFEVSAHFDWERKQGTAPYTGYLGQDDDLGFIEELAQPVSYDTQNKNVTFGYAKKPYYFSVAYDNSTFANNISKLFFGNPFRLTDAPNDNPVLNPPLGELQFIPGISLSGASMGMMPLPPNNSYDAITLNGVLMDLPLSSRLALHYTTAWTNDNSAIPPYTSNSALLQPANLGDYSGGTPPAYTPMTCTGLGCPALPPPALPATLNGLVHTTTFFARFSMEPFSFVHLNAHYNSYAHDNSTPQIIMTKVVGDTVWDPGIFRNAPFSFHHFATGVDVGIDLLKATTLTLSYESNETDKFNLEIGKYFEDKYEAALDTTPLSWLNFRASYKDSRRHSPNNLTPATSTGAWNGTAFTSDSPPNIIPWLRRFDQANRNSDKVKYLLTLSPVDELAFSSSLYNGRDIYPDSNFGLQWQTHNGWAVSADYTPSDRLNFFLDYEQEHYDALQESRHWKPGVDNINGFPMMTGDPYTTELGIYSPSNWTAENPEKETYFAAGFKYGIVPKNVDFSAKYSMSDVKGSILFASPLGSVAGSPFNAYVPGYPTYVPGGSDFNFYVPMGLFNFDNTKLYNIDAHFNCKIVKDVTTTFGWMWEKFYSDDFNNYGFTYTPYINKATTVTGALLMGTWPTSYNVNVFYGQVNYRF